MLLYWDTDLGGESGRGIGRPGRAPANELLHDLAAVPISTAARAGRRTSQHGGAERLTQAEPILLAQPREAAHKAAEQALAPQRGSTDQQLRAATLASQLPVQVAGERPAPLTEEAVWEGQLGPFRSCGGGGRIVVAYFLICFSCTEADAYIVFDKKSASEVSVCHGKIGGVTA